MADIYSRLHNVHETEFSVKYFHEKNVQHLQKELQSLLLKSGYKTKPQCYDAVLSYMMNIFELYANPLTNDYTNETLKLNAIVLDKMFNTMITEIKQYIGYIKDASTLPDPIDRPTHMTSKQSIQYDEFF